MKSSFVILLLMLAGLLLGAEVRAEAFIDVHWGITSTSDHRSDVVIPPQFFNPSGPDSLTGPNYVERGQGVAASFEDSSSYGIRAGYWFGKWAGLAVDVFKFKPTVDAEGFTQGANLRVIPISALLMLRWPLLASEEYPLGRLHPYMGGGPSLFLTKFEGDVDLALLNFPNTGPFPGTPNVEPTGEFSSKNVDPGMELLVGLDFQILPFVGVFTEYRYTLAEPVWSDTVPPNDTVPANERYEALSTDFQVPLRTHHIVAGITFRF